MNALEALAWTLPPSLACVTCCRLLLRALLTRKLTDEQVKRIDALEERVGVHDQDHDTHSDSVERIDTELKRVNEQLSQLADRYR